MEDAFTRQHAQYLVAASVVLGAQLVRRAADAYCARQRPPFVDLHASGVKPSREAQAAVQRAAQSAVRQALREDPHAVQLLPIENGYRVRVLLQPQRAPLQPYELTDLQVAWKQAQERELGPARPALPAQRDVTLRQQELDSALAGLHDVHTRLVQGQPALQVELADAMNRAQIATDALRDAVRRAQPLRHDRRTYCDTLAFRVHTQGAAHLPLVDRERALRDTFARAAGLGNPEELRVLARPTRNPDESLVRVTFNTRNTPQRRSEHLNLDSLRDAILSGAAHVPSIPVRAGAQAARFAVTAIESCRVELATPTPTVAPDLPMPRAIEATPLLRMR